MRRKMKKVWRILSVPMVIIFLCYLGGCQKRGDGPTDKMTILKTDSGIRIDLNEEACAQFLLPDLKGCGLPRIEIYSTQSGFRFKDRI
jgi:hypothetical protein